MIIFTLEMKDPSTLLSGAWKNGVLMVSLCSAAPKNR
jgi:hypothetical protein